MSMTYFFKCGAIILQSNSAKHLISKKYVQSVMASWVCPEIGYTQENLWLTMLYHHVHHKILLRTVEVLSGSFQYCGFPHL